MKRVVAVLALATGCGGSSAPLAPPPDRALAPAATTSASAPAGPASAAALEHVRQNVTRSEAAWVARSPRDLQILYTPDASIVSFGAEGRRAETPEEMVRGLSGFWSDLAEVRMRTARVVTAGDVAAVEWVVAGSTREGRVLGVPGLSLMWFGADGLVRKEHLFIDEQTTAMQLGDPGARGRPPLGLPAATTFLAASGATAERASTDLAKAFYRSLADKDVDALAGLLADEAVYRDLARPDDVVGRENIARDFRQLVAAFPDLAVDPTDVVATPSHVVVAGTWSGTMTGALGGLASTNRRGDVHFADVLEIAGGKIVRLTSYTNGAELAAAFFRPGK